jgi:hypothetical protein
MTVTAPIVRNGAGGRRSGAQKPDLSNPSSAQETLDCFIPATATGLIVRIVDKAEIEAVREYGIQRIQPGLVCRREYGSSVSTG